MIELLKTIFPPTHRHPRRFPHEWRTSTELDPVLRPLEAHEHGIVRRIDAQMVHANGLILDYEGDGPTSWRVA
jgi:hypothetical protein